MRIKRTRKGARLLQGGAVLSEILKEPGPTHSVFDVLAACIATLGTGPQVGVLGFAGGGLVAPLRAMGHTSAIQAVDLDLEGERLFHEVASGWEGEINVAEGDALQWLKRSRTAFDVLVEDLSELGPEGETKPAVSAIALPSLIAKRLAPTGIAVVNLLPVPGVSWHSLTAQVSLPWEHAVVVYLHEFENRIVIAGRVPGVRSVSARLRAALASIKSRMATAITVRAAKPRRAQRRGRR